MGKFHGTIAPTTPSGVYRVTTFRSSLSSITSSGSSNYRHISLVSMVNMGAPESLGPRSCKGLPYLGDFRKPCISTLDLGAGELELSYFNNTELEQISCDLQAFLAPGSTTEQIPLDGSSKHLHISR